MPKTGRLQETVFAVFVTFVALLPAPLSHAATYSGGSGTELAPYLIATPQDLQDLSNTANSADWDKHFLMPQDIDMVGITSFTPIGNNTTKFTGIVDGGGFAVQNLTLDLPMQDNVGLFGRVSGSGEVKDLGLEGGNVVGREYVGGLAGRNEGGAITDCYTTGPVSGNVRVGGLIGSSVGGTISLCHTTGQVDAAANIAGGLIGESSDDVTDCYHTTGTVTAWTGVGGLLASASDGYVVTGCYSTSSVVSTNTDGNSSSAGGLIGGNSAVVTSCYTTGDVSGRRSVGGLVGNNNATGQLTDCYAAGAVDAPQDFVGGLVGSAHGIITNCFAVGPASGRDSTGGLIGKCKTATVTGCYATGSVSGRQVGGLVGWLQGGTVTSCYATGVVSASGTSGGGLVADSQGTVYTSFWDRDTTGQTGGGGGKGLSTAEMQTVGIYQNADWSTHGWVMAAGQYPRLAWESTGDPPIPAPESIPLPGTGTELDPYVVSTPAEFASLSWHVGFLSAHVLLANDIDCTAVTLWPIGDLGPFSGVFDGRARIISNITLDRPESDYIGLFAATDAGAQLREVRLEGLVIAGRSYVGGLVGRNGIGSTVLSCSATGGVSASDSYIGGLAGQNLGGSISSSQAFATVSGDFYVGGLVGKIEGGGITNCSASGSVTGKRFVGGLAASNDGIVAGCSSTCSVTAMEYYAAGLICTNSDTVEDCYSQAETSVPNPIGGYVGGLIENNSGVVTRCYASGAVWGNDDLGGLIVRNEAPGSVSFSLWDEEASGLRGSCRGKGAPTAQMQSVSTFANAGWAGHGWVMNEGEYPRLAWEGTGAPPIPAVIPIPLAGSGTGLDPYLVTTAAEFVSLSWHKGFLDAHIELAADLDCTAGRLCPIGDLDVFSGTFDGGGHTISNATIEQPGGQYIGIFSMVAATGELRNLGLHSALVNGARHVGGLVGANFGTITNCYARGNVSGGWYVGGLVGDNDGSYGAGTVTNSYAMVTVTDSNPVFGTERFGGLAGWNSGALTACHATGSVNGVNDYVGGLVGYNDGGSVTGCYGTGVVFGRDDVGGLIGENNNAGTVTACYSTGMVVGRYQNGGFIGMNGNGTVSDCYAIGAVHGEQNVGGLAGWNSGALTSCYATGTVAGNTYLGGLAGGTSGAVTASFWDVSTGGPDNGVGTGLPTAQMQKRATFESVGWDFSAGDGDDPDWVIYEENSYPRLYAMPVPVVSVSDLQLLNIVSGGQFFLTADIDASETTGWSSKSTLPGFAPIGSAASPFNGILHGYGHRIHGLHISRPTTDNVGLFGYIGATGLVDELGLEQVTITGRDLVGGLAGVNLGTVERCYVRGEVSGVNAVGGLIGDNQGTVSNSYAAAALTGNTVGGLIGTDSSKSGKALPQSSAFGGPDSGAQAANIEED